MKLFQRLCQLLLIFLGLLDPNIQQRSKVLSDNPTTDNAGLIEHASGLQLLYSPPRNSALVDVVAVHGLGGHPLRTWTASNGHFWLQDFLPQELPYARVFTFGYDSKLTFSKSAATIADFATALLDEIDNFRTDSKDRPLIFICHSLGGIVVKKALVLGHEQDHRYGRIVGSTIGIVFLGTPHTGSKLASWTAFSRDIIDISPFGPSIVRKDLLKDLETNSRTLQLISDSFQHRAMAIKIASFYERVFTLPLKHLVVDEHSARLHFPGEEALPMEYNHREMCKIKSMESQHWRSLSGAIKRQVENLGLELKYIEMSSKGVAQSPSPVIKKRIEELLRPISFTEETDQIVNFEMCPDTGRWVLNDPSYTLWNQENSCTTLWIHGAPGSGKSYLAHFLTSKLPRVNRGHSALAFFACDRAPREQSRSDKLTLYFTLLAQLLDQLSLDDPEGANHVLDDFEARQAIIGETTPFELWKMFQSLLGPLKSYTIVIDALDELQEYQDVLTFTRRLADETGGKIKLIFTSRDLDTIRAIIRIKEDEISAAEISLDSERMREDIEKFVKWRTKHMDFRDLGERSTIVRDLVESTDGIILLAKYRIGALVRRTQEGKGTVSDIIRSLPESVSAYYDQILWEIQQMPIEDKITAENIFLWTVFGLRPLTFAELAELHTIRHPTWREYSKDIRPLTRGRLDDTCRGLIVLRNDEAYLAHGSVREYLLDYGLTQLSVHYLKPPNDLSVQAEFATVLLNYLHNIPVSDDPKEFWNCSTIMSYPILGYAVPNWPMHMFSALGINVFAFQKFLSSHQCRQWWQLWSRSIVFGIPDKFQYLQSLFRRYVHSLSKNQRAQIHDIIGTDFPLFMQERQNEHEISAPDCCTKQHRIETLSTLARMYVLRENWQEAAKIGKQVLAMQDRITRATVSITSTIAQVLKAQGRPYEAFQKKLEVYEFTAVEYGDQHIYTLIALDNLSLYYMDIGDLYGADRSSSQALELATRLLDPMNPETITVIMNRATILSRLKRLDEALILAGDAFERSTKTMGIGHPTSIISLDNLASFLHEQGDTESALQTRLGAYCIAVEYLGFEHHTTSIIGRELEEIYMERSDWNALANHRRGMVDYYSKEYGENDERTLSSMNSVLLAYMRTEDWEKCKAVGEKLVAFLKLSEIPESNPIWVFALGKMMRVYMLLHDHQAATALGENIIHIYEHTRGFRSDLAWENIHMLALAYRELENWPKAVERGELAVRVAEMLFGRDSDDWIKSQRDLQTIVESLGDWQASYNIALEILGALSDIYGRGDPKSVCALMDVFNIYQAAPGVGNALDIFEQFVTAKKLCLEAYGDECHSKQGIEQAMAKLLQWSSRSMRREMERIQNRILESITTGIQKTTAEQPRHTDEGPEQVGSPTKNEIDEQYEDNIDAANALFAQFGFNFRPYTEGIDVLERIAEED